MVAVDTVLNITLYYHMLFFVGLTFFTPQLAAQYKLGAAAEDKSVLLMMKFCGSKSLTRSFLTSTYL